MKFVKNIGKNLKSGKRKINPKIRICLECGSTLTAVNHKKITCGNCGKSKRFDNKPRISIFKKGDTVKIIDSEKNANLLYKIKKIKKSQEGTIQYLLKSKSSNISLLYHESDESHLEKVQKFQLD